jgi:signal transduction histidine kinase
MSSIPLVAISSGSKDLQVIFIVVGILAVITSLYQIRGTAIDVVDAVHLALYPLMLVLMVWYWRDRVNKLERRLSFLQHITNIANPRFGVDHTVGLILQQLKGFYEAASCLLVVTDANSGKDSLYRVRQHEAANVRGISIEKGLASVFLSLPQDYGCIWKSRGKAWKTGKQVVNFYDLAGHEVSSDELRLSEKLVTTLEARNFMSIPVCHDKKIGRLYILDSRNRLSGRDVAFVHQVTEHVMRVMENMRLVDRLATEAAEVERHKIARDIHDSIVQPYIGIQIGLSALKEKVDSGINPGKDIARLIEITEAEIEDLRRYMKGLKGSRALEFNFVQAVKRLASKFAEASGITVEVSTDKNVLINDRLAAEAFQIIAEGLSNIRRHTHARKAYIHIKCVAGEFSILIKNDKDGSETAAPFLPRSISERTAALGGRVLVQHAHQAHKGTTVLNITIPL